MTTILVTRPAPDNETTAAALRARGYEALSSPMLRFETIPFSDDDDIAFDGVILTSANAVRALSAHPTRANLLASPVFAVGGHTAEVAREAGFTDIVTADGDANSLRATIVAQVKAGKLKKNATLCYLAGADISRDLAGELGESGFTVITRTSYRMIPVGDLSPSVVTAFQTGGIDAVLHYSRRSARAFLDAARASGVEISALALPQCCLSEAVATVLHDAGARKVAAARVPEEAALFDTLDRAVKPASK